MRAAGYPGRPSWPPYAMKLPEAARHVGLSVPMLRRQIAAGRLPVVRVGRAVLVRRRDLERFVDAHLADVDEEEVLP